MKERLLGVVMLVAGGVLGYFSIYEPLQKARRGEPEVSVSIKGAIIAPLTLIGIPYLLLGSRVVSFMGTREKPTTLAYLSGIALALVGVGIYVWLRTTLQSYGYDFHGRL